MNQNDKLKKIQCTRLSYIFSVLGFSGGSILVMIYQAMCWFSLNYANCASGSIIVSFGEYAYLYLCFFFSVLFALLSKKLVPIGFASVIVVLICFYPNLPIMFGLYPWLKFCILFFLMMLALETKHYFTVKNKKRDVGYVKEYISARYKYSKISYICHFLFLFYLAVPSLIFRALEDYLSSDVLRNIDNIMFLWFPSLVCIFCAAIISAVLSMRFRPNILLFISMLFLPGSVLFFEIEGMSSADTSTIVGFSTLYIIYLLSGIVFYILDKRENKRLRGT